MPFFSTCAMPAFPFSKQGVTFANLGLAVVDEQQRFGVEQRAALKQAGRAQEQPLTPHLLVMSATPIPRSLALTVYGDLDLSIIDELPPGRQPIKTYVIHPDERERAYGFVQSQVAQGRQVYIICPLVEESEQTEARAAVAEHERLQREVFPRLSLGLLHGRMRGDEKETVMQAFARNETQVLVSTSVVEVGIDVPNATVMLVEGANHFGLAQLHQLRGRGGRGEFASFCLLLVERDGFAIHGNLAVAVDVDDLLLRRAGERFDVAHLRHLQADLALHLRELRPHHEEDDEEKEHVDHRRQIQRRLFVEMRA